VKRKTLSKLSEGKNKMNMYKSVLCLISLSFGCHVQALTMDTSVEYLIGGSTELDGSDTGVSPDTITSLVEGNDARAAFGGTSFARATNNSGIGAVAVDANFSSGNGGIHELSAQTTNSEVISNTSGGSQEFFYDFTVFAPTLLLSDFAGASTGMIGAPTATYDISVLVDGTSVWSSSAVLNGGKNGHDLTESGTDLGGTFFSNPNFPTSIFGYQFDDFIDTVSLGVFDDGDSFLFETFMEVSISASPYELGGSAYIGDPGNINNPGGMGGTILASSTGTTGPTPVSEPASFALFAFGLLGMTFVRKRNIQV